MADPQLDPALISAVKGFEGFAPKAQWDYKQHSNGYGTKATSPGEMIDRETAEQRLASELGNAQSQVDSFSPGLPPGARNALSSLTFNAGPGWMNSGLGAAIKAGDMDKAQSLFRSYNKAGGQENPGLAARRQQEASWFNPSAPVTAAAAPGAPPAGTAPSAAPPGGPAIGMLAGQMPIDPNAGQPEADPNLALLQQRAAQMMQEQPEAPPPMAPIAMPMPRGQLAARLRAAALGRGLTGGV